MLVFKKKYYLFVQNTRDLNLNLIKIRGKFNIIYRNLKSKEKIETLRIYRNNCKKNGVNLYIANDTNPPYKIKLTDSLNNINTIISTDFIFIDSGPPIWNTNPTPYQYIYNLNTNLFVLLIHCFRDLMYLQN